MPNYHDNNFNNIRYYKVIDDGQIFPYLSLQYIMQLNDKFPPTKGINKAEPLSKYLRREQSEIFTRSEVLKTEKVIREAFQKFAEKER